MLPAVVKLCCGISYPHLRSTAGLQRPAAAVIGQEISHLLRWGRMQHDIGTHPGLSSTDRSNKLKERPSWQREDNQCFYIQQGKEAMKRALDMLADQDGWRVETAESNGDVICSKLMPGARKVFRLEADLEGSVEELYDLLFVRVEEIHLWNPSIQQIKILKQAGPETMVTHEVSAKTAGNLIGQRDFLSIRHSCRQRSRVFLGGAAIQLESFPPQDGFVRAEDGPTCIIIQAVDGDTRKSRFTWLLNMDVKGWLPTSLVNQALPQAQLDFTKHLRRRLAAGATLS